jgi:hypothetical protein
MEACNHVFLLLQQKRVIFPGMLPAWDAVKFRCKSLSQQMNTSPAGPSEAGTALIVVDGAPRILPAPDELPAEDAPYRDRL